MFASLPSVAQERPRQAATLAPEAPSRLERLAVGLKRSKRVRLFTTGLSGFRIAIGGMITGAGIAAGPEYIRRDLAGENLIFRTSLRGSYRGFYIAETQLVTPNERHRRLILDLNAVHRDFPRIDYYGPGPDSSKGGRSNFRLEDTSYNLTGGIRPVGLLSMGVTGSYLQVNVGPGGDRRFVSTERLFTPVMTPGLGRQSDFLRGGAFLELDYRDNPEGPRSGGNYKVEVSSYGDQKLKRHSFRRLDLELQQYIPFFNQRRVIALRGKSVLTDARRGHTVPFYLQPTLGGADDLRGFRPFRFYDDNMMALNAEYRWEVFSGMDMALFADAGKVFHRQAEWNFRNLEAAYGIGTRFNVRNDVFLRMDVGFSHEGFQFWLKFQNPF